MPRAGRYSSLELEPLVAWRVVVRHEPFLRKICIRGPCAYVQGFGLKAYGPDQVRGSTPGVARLEPVGVAGHL